MGFHRLMSVARSGLCYAYGTRMAEVGGAPGFGQVDLDIEDEPNVTARPPAASRSPSHRGFGELDLDLADLGDEQDEAEAPPPPSTSRVFGPGTAAKPVPATKPARSKKPTERTVARSISLDDLQGAVRPEARARESVHDESTRVVSGDALSAITRPPPALSNEEAGPPSARSGGQSASGVAAHDRVAAMRDLYARGDADGALALATSLGDSQASLARGRMADHPDASIVVEFAEQSIDLLDPFGGLIPIEDALAATATVRPGAAPSAPSAPPPAAHLTLTERQSIPRLLKSMGEVSKLKIDHRAGFLLAHVDGMQTLEEILDICAMPSAEALSLIATLKDMGVIEFE